MDGMAEPRRKRLRRDERERLILEEAIKFFAEVGFEGQTRALADRLGVTQPLLYRYFPDKETLIARVFDEMMVKRWHPEWDSLLRDRSRPLLLRLKDFYRQFNDVQFTYEWVRLVLFAGLKGGDLGNCHQSHLRQQVLVPVCTELRHASGLPAPEQSPLTSDELELAWALHGSIFQLAMRRWVCQQDVPEDVHSAIDTLLEAQVPGAIAGMRALAA